MSTIRVVAGGGASGACTVRAVKSAYGIGDHVP